MKNTYKIGDTIYIAVPNIYTETVNIFEAIIENIHDNQVLLKHDYNLYATLDLETDSHLLFDNKFAAQTFIYENKQVLLVREQIKRDSTELLEKLRLKNE
jgi:hypothetical protein